MIHKACAMAVLMVFTFCTYSPLYAQGDLPMNEVAGKQYLQDRGVSEEEFRLAMLARGYDLDNLEPTPELLDELQRVSVEVIDSLAQAKKAEVQAQVDQTLDEVGSDVAEEITEAIEEGASPEEAVAEQLREQSSEISEDPGRGIYGHQLFKGRDANVFRQADRIKPPRSYVLGTGDEVSVFVNGASQLQATGVIDERGYFQVTPYPPIPLRGLTVAQAEDLLKQRLRQYMVFNDNQFALTVLAARTITVNFYGEVANVGGITISAVNTLFNALVAAGGPTEIGSVRRIKLISGSETKVFDTYAYMQDPTVVQNFYLHDNDYVQIPVADRIVSIRGAVRRPYKYELLEDEHLLKLIEYAGGLNHDAYLRDIQITRFGEDQRVVVNVNLREILASGGDYLLQPGDEVVIQNMDDVVANYVDLRGAVIKDGRYERKEGMRVADLIDAGVLLDEARLDFGYVLRIKPDGKYEYMRFVPQVALDNRSSTENFELSDMDIVHIPSQVNYTDAVSFSVLGSVRTPGEYSFDPGGIMRVEDAILISGGLRTSASEVGYVVRRTPDEPRRAEYIPFNPKVAISDPSAKDNLILMPFDSVFVFDQLALTDSYFITVGGAVRSPDRYDYEAGITLGEALTLAGGLRFDAASNRVEIARVIFGENIPTRIESFMVTVDKDLKIGGADSSIALLPFDQVYVRQVPDFKLQRTVRLVGEVRFPGTYALIQDNERLANVIQRAGGLTAEAYPAGAQMERVQGGIGSVVINMEKAVQQPNSTANMILLDGDVISIPMRQDLVSITGAVNLRDFYPEEFVSQGNKISVAYDGNHNAKYYVDNYAAGLAEGGKKRLISVEHPNGRVEKTSNFLFFKIYPKVPPGGIVHVGREIPKEEVAPAEREDIDWGAVLRDTLAQATAIITLIVLIDRL